MRITLSVVAVLLTASLASAQEAPKTGLRLAQGVYLTSQAADLWTTHQAIQSGRGVEANPLMAGSDGKRIALKATTSAGALGLSEWLSRKGHRKAATVTLYTLSAVTFGIAAQNGRVK